MKLEYIKAKTTDMELIEEMFIDQSLDEGKLQFPKTSRKKMSLNLKKYKKIRTKNFLNDIKDTRNNWWFLVKQKKEIIGMIHAQKQKMQVYTIVTIEKVYVKKEFRGKGLAKKMVKHILRLLKKKGIKKVESGIYAKNTPSIKLHESLGFKPLSVKFRKKL